MPQVQYDAMVRAHRLRERRRAYPVALLACAKANQCLQDDHAPHDLEEFMPYPPEDES